MAKNYYVVMNNTYPFGTFTKQLQKQETIAVREIIPVKPEQQKSWKKKISIIKQLSTTTLIQTESIYETEQGFHFIYEYIPIKIQEWLPKLDHDFILHLRGEMIKLCKELTDHDIKTSIGLNKLGINAQYQPKYFLGWDFEIDPTINRQKLNSSYVKSINHIFQPFLQQKQTNQGNSHNHETGQLKSSTNSFSSVEKADQAIDKAKEALHNVKEKRAHRGSGQWKQKQASGTFQYKTNERSVDKSSQSLGDFGEMSIIQLQQQKSERIHKISSQLNEIKAIIGNRNNSQKKKRNSMEIEHNYEPFRKNLDKYRQNQEKNRNEMPFNEHEEDYLSQNMLQQLYEALEYEDAEQFHQAKKAKAHKTPQQLQMQKSSKLTQHNKKLVKVQQYLNEYKKKMQGEVVWQDSGSLQKKISNAINNSLKVMGSFKGGKKQH